MWKLFDPYWIHELKKKRIDGSLWNPEKFLTEQIRFKIRVAHWDVGKSEIVSFGLWWSYIKEANAIKISFDHKKDF